ncbi:MAG: CYTH domain-containing protein, partial [candidate division WOR-3 bacterium]
ILPKESKKLEIIYLENIDEGLAFWSALLRILDVIDKGLHRVGWGSEEDSKIITAIEDAIYYVKELRKEKESLENNIGDLRYIKQYSSFFDDMNKLINDLRKFIKEKYIEKIKELNKKIRKPEEFVKDAESMYLELYEDINKLKSFNNSVKDKMENLFGKEYIAKIKLLSEQIFFLLDSPLHFYTHRSVKNPSIEKCKDGYKIVYYFNESFIKLPDQKNFTFGDLNRILQEGWKIWSDIYREYIPIKEILKNRVEFKEIEFRYKKDYKDIPLLTLPFNEKFVEAELKLKFDTEKEMNEFVKNIKEVFGLPKEKPPLEIEDSFYDTSDGELRKRKWWLRKRSTENNTEGKWEIKIEPLYWKGDYEYRIELGPVFSEENNISEIFKNLLKNSRLFPNWDELQEIIKIKFNEQPFITYTQKRISFEWNEIEICVDTIYKKNGNPIKSPLYIVEFEIKKGEPYEKNRKIQEIKEKIKEKIKENLPEMEKYICPKTKIELVEEIKNEKNIDSG